MINGQYSLLRYSANIGSSIDVEESFTEELKGVSGSAVFIDIVDGFDESAVCLGRVTASVITTADVINQMGHDVSMMANSVVEDAFYSSVLETVRTAQDIYVSVVSSTDILSVSYLSIDTPTSLSAEEAVFGSSRVCKNITDSATYPTEVLLGTVGGGTVEDLVLTLDVTIPPGGELRIDSENYTVTLNGENVLYAQSGYWPILSRELAQMTIDSGTGGEMTGEIVYAERWL